MSGSVPVWGSSMASLGFVVYSATFSLRDLRRAQEGAKLKQISQIILFRLLCWDRNEWTIQSQVSQLIPIASKAQIKITGSEPTCRLYRRVMKFMASGGCKELLAVRSLRYNLGQKRKELFLHLLLFLREDRPEFFCLMKYFLLNELSGIRTSVSSKLQTLNEFSQFELHSFCLFCFCFLTS